MSGSLFEYTQLSLDLVDGAPSAVAVVFISFLSSSPSPFLGGTLYSFSPFTELLVIGTDGAGEVHGAVVFPPAPSGLELWFQVALVDASVPIYGASLSNAMKGTVS